MKPNFMYKVGETEDKKDVVGGMFAAYDTHGIPLDMTIDFLEHNGYIPGFHDFVEKALAAGWKMTKIKVTIKYAVLNKGVEYWNEIEARINKHFEGEVS